MSIVHSCDFGAKVQLLQRLNTFLRFIGVLLKTCVVCFYLWCTVLFDILEDANAVIIDDVSVCRIVSIGPVTAHIITFLPNIW